MRAKDVRPGKHVYHDSGDYLGVITGGQGPIVRFKGPRMRDGRPVTMATIYETKLGPAPVDNAGDPS